MTPAEAGQLGADVAKHGSRVRELADVTPQAIGALLGAGPHGRRARNLLRWARQQRLDSQKPDADPTQPPVSANPDTPVADVAPTLADEVAGDQRARRAKVDADRWRDRYNHLLVEHDRLKAEHDAALGLRDAHPPIRIEPTFGTGTSEAVAIAVASDWHVEERVERATVNGRNEYNLDVAERRAAAFFDRLLRMVKKERQDVKIETLVLALLGDFITGRLHEENLETCELRPMDAILFAQRLLAGGISFLLEHSDLNLVIPCRPGNHSRITRHVHAATEDGNALETLMYATLRQMFVREPRVKFEIQPAYHCLLDVYGYRVRLHHGHAVHYGGGVGGLHIPLRKALAQWDATERAHLDCIGHWHTYAATTRRYVVNGSLIGMNAYGVRIKADFEPPIQAFLLLDKRRGVTVQIPLLVD